MAAPLRRRAPGSSRGGSRIQLSLSSLTCLLVIAFPIISLIGLALQFIAVHHIIDTHKNNDLLNINNPDTAAATSLMIRGASSDLQSSTETKKKATIAYTVTITGCKERWSSEKEAASLITQGAAVLQQSIRLAHTSSNYDYQMYAIVHPTATSCSVAPLQKLGYQVLIRNTPFETSDIATKFLRENIDKTVMIVDRRTN